MTRGSTSTNPTARHGHAGKRREPVRITTAPESVGSEMAGRQKRYLFSMALRTLCFVGAVLVGDNVFRWILVAGAVFLPYIAVVMANTVSPRLPGAPVNAPTPEVHRELPPRQ